MEYTGNLGKTRVCGVKYMYSIGTGTSPAGPAMAGPFSVKVETQFCVVSFPDCSKIRQATYVSAHT